MRRTNQLTNMMTMSRVHKFIDPSTSVFCNSVRASMDGHCQKNKWRKSYRGEAADDEEEEASLDGITKLRCHEKRRQSPRLATLWTLEWKAVLIPAGCIGKKEQQHRQWCTMVQDRKKTRMNSHPTIHCPMSEWVKWVSERTSEHSGSLDRSEKCGASKLVVQM